MPKCHFKDLIFNTKQLYYSNFKLKCFWPKTMGSVIIYCRRGC